MRLIRYTCALPLILALPSHAQTAADQPAPEENVLETVEVVGLRSVPLGEISSSVTLLSASDLAVRDSAYIADQLRAVPGLAVSRSGSQGSLTQIRIRGAEANHTLALLNGVEISDPVTGETDFGLFSGLSLSEVEIARGEHSALYGSDAIGGVINLVTADREGLVAEAEFGTHGTLRGSVELGSEIANGPVTLALSGFDTAGVDSSGRDGEKDGSDSWSALTTTKQDFGTAGTLSGVLTYRSTTSQTDPDLDFDGLLDNADRESESNQWLIGGAYDLDALGLNHQIKASYNEVERENFADGLATDQTTGERTKLSYSPSIELPVSAGSINIAGLVDWEREDYERRGEASSYGDPNQNQRFDTLGYAVEFRGVFNKLALDASVRRDENDGRFDDATTWRAGAAYALSDTTQLRASGGKGIKNPTFTELFGFYPGSFVGNPDLVPESSTSWEIGIDQRFGRAEFSLTYFEADLENEIYTAYTPSFASTPKNRVGESSRFGIEAGGRLALTESFHLSASASQISSENETGVDEIRVPEFTASLAIDWTHPEVNGLRAGIALDYVGEQKDTDFGTYQTVTLDSYVLASGTFEYPITDRASFTLRGENLFDQEVTDVFGYHAPGATAFVGIKLR